MVTGETEGPAVYVLMYGDRNPWVRWLREHAPELLQRPVVEFWFGDERRQWEKVAAQER